MIPKIQILKVVALLLFTGFTFSFFGLVSAISLSIFFGIAQWNYFGNDPDPPPAKGVVIGMGVFLAISFSMAHLVGYWDHPIVSAALLASWYVCISIIFVKMERDARDRQAEQGADRKPDNVAS